MPLSDTPVLLSLSARESTAMFPPQGKIERKKKKNPFFLSTVVNTWRSLGTDWFSKTNKQKQNSLSMHYSGCLEVHWAGWWMLSPNLGGGGGGWGGKFGFFVRLSSPNWNLFQRALWAEEPDLEPLLPQDKHILVSIENIPTIWTTSGEEAQMAVGTLVLHLKFPLGQDKTSIISHSYTMEDHSNYDFCHN